LAEPIPQQLSVVNEHNTRFCALLATLHIPLVAGRIFTERDAHESAPVVIINKAIARQFIANAVADASKTRKEDVRARKLTIAAGTGKVHGEVFVLANWGLDDSPAVS
jgi:hypothetical protein